MPDLIKLTQASAPWTPIRPAYYLSPLLGVAYLQIPKAACSSILSWMVQHENPVKFTEIKTSLARSPFVLHHSGPLLTTSHDPGELLRFTFVRHPFSRVVSFYRNQVSANSSITDPLEKRIIDGEIAASGFTPGMSFEDYLDAILSGGKTLCDPHVRPQVDFVLAEKGLNVDFMGKLEELSHHRDFLRKNLRVDPESLPKINPTKDCGVRGGQLSRKYVDALAHLYAEDLRVLKYTRDYP